MNRPRIIAAGLTALIAILTVILLCVVHLRVDTTVHEWPPRHDGEIAMADDEYFDVLSPVPLPSSQEVAATFNEVPAANQSDPAPESGHDVADRGTPGDAPATTTTKRPSTVKAKEKTPEKPAGPSKEEQERARREEEARRRANQATQSAFQRSEGANNTASNGKTPGNSGNPSGTSTSLNGTGTGSVGGGWIMPRYAKVPSTLTGSIKVEAKIDRNGRVTSVTFIGGQPPASTDTRLRSAVEAEVRAHRFTRSDNSEAPSTARAIITYTFR